MSYRTYINNTQVFGNNECYPEWIKYVESKGITVGEDGDYEGELDDFMEALDVVESIVMRLESERRERKRREKSSSTRVFLIWGIFTMKLLKIRKKKACSTKNSITLRTDICLCRMRSLKPAKTSSNTKVIPGEGNIQKFSS